MTSWAINARAWRITLSKLHTGNQSDWVLARTLGGSHQSRHWGLHRDAERILRTHCTTPQRDRNVVLPIVLHGSVPPGPTGQTTPLTDVTLATFMALYNRPSATRRSTFRPTAADAKNRRCQSRATRVSRDLRGSTVTRGNCSHPLDSPAGLAGMARRVRCGRT